MENSSKKASKGYQWATCSSSYSAMANLPGHILMEILRRLRIKTLMVSSCVCKSWLHLIKDPHFAEMYSAKAPNEVLLLSSSSRHYTSNAYIGNIHFRNNCVSRMELITLFPLSRFSVRRNNVVNSTVGWSEFKFANSCRGLLCYCGILSANRFAVIWNPITGEYITVAGTRVLKGLPKCYAYGLGFSRKSTRYKLLREMRWKEFDVVTGSETATQYFEICTFEEGSSWKNIGYCPHSSWLQCRPVFLEGALHWICRDIHSSRTIIVSFDFESEQFGKVPLPRQFEIEKPRWLAFDVLGGCLCLFDMTNKDCVDIWVMKEYGVQSSWTKTLSIEKDTKEKENLSYVPIEYLDNGEILMLYKNNHLLAYHPSHLLSAREIGSWHKDVHVTAYSPSLVLMKNVLMGYNAPVLNVKSWEGHRMLREFVEDPSWWDPTDYPYMTKSPQKPASAPPTNDEMLPEKRGSTVSMIWDWFKHPHLCLRCRINWQKSH